MSFKSFVKKAGSVLKKVAPAVKTLLPTIPGLQIPTGVKAITDAYKRVKSGVRKVQTIMGPAGDRSNRGPAPVNTGGGPVSSADSSPSSEGQAGSMRTVQRSPVV